MKILERSLSPEVKKAAQVLKNGGVVIFPTDTVYGVGCIYNNKKALGKIYKIKARPQTLPFPILVSSMSQAEGITKMNKLAKDLARKYWPGGLTIITKSKDGDANIGIRMPNSQIVKELIEETGSPIVGTSANFHGQESVSDFESLDRRLLRLTDFVIEGKCQKGQESTIVDTTREKIKIIRRGAVNITI